MNAMAGKTPKKLTKFVKQAAAGKPKRAAGKGKRRAPAKREAEPASKRMDGRIRELGEWRARTLQTVREIIQEVDPEAVEEVKWRKPSNSMLGVPVWSHGGMICTGETYKDKVKLTFAKGASLEDPSRLFNSSLDGNVRRAIDIREGDPIDEAALKDLIRAAVALNLGTRKAAKVAQKAAARGVPMSPSRNAAEPKLLSGGNPQIAKGYGDAPVQAYIAAMPGWKRDVGRRLDAIIVRTIPGVRKAVKWNSPLYGIEGDKEGGGGWFLSFHCFTKYVKVAFFRGTSLRPVPPGESKQKEVRYLDIHEDDRIDEAQVAAWVQ
jgi:hypothetical protein